MKFCSLVFLIVVQFDAIVRALRNEDGYSEDALLRRVLKKGGTCELATDNIMRDNGDLVACIDISPKKCGEKLRFILEGETCDGDEKEVRWNQVGPPGAPGQDGDSCSASPSPAGIDITCGDNPSVSLSSGSPGQPGQDGDDCSASPSPAGIDITCGDNSSVSLPSGSPGQPGQDGDSCSASPTPSGVDVKCGENGTPVPIPSGPPGQDGKDGDSCSASPTPNGIDIKCGENGTPVPVPIPSGPPGLDGNDGNSCSASPTPTGVDIKCGDNGPLIPLPNGAPGQNGQNGDSCSASPTPAGVDISCGNDGPAVELLHGQDGDSCSASPSPSGGVDITCGDNGTPVPIPSGSPGQNGQNGDSCSASPTPTGVDITCGTDDPVPLPSGPPGPNGILNNFIKIEIDENHASGQYSSSVLSTSDTGGNAAHNNMPPFLGVHYIIALQGVYPSRSRRDRYLEEAEEGQDEAQDYKQAHRRLSADPFLGEIIMFAGNFAPRGWAFCDGQLLTIAQNSALFSLLGTTYGGDGRTTFALPELRGRFPIHPGTGPGLPPLTLGQTGGEATVTLTQSEIPSHNHLAAEVHGRVTEAVDSPPPSP